MKRVYIVKHQGHASKGLVSVQEAKTARTRYRDQVAFKQACTRLLGGLNGTQIQG